MIVGGLASCANITVKSPDGTATASYRGTVMLGDESVSVGQFAGVTTATVTGRDVQGIAQAVLPLVARYFGIPGAPVPPLPSRSTSATSTPAASLPPVEQPFTLLTPGP